MIFLYSKSNSDRFEDALSTVNTPESRRLKETVAALLKARGLSQAAQLCFEFPFQLVYNSDLFGGDDFHALHATVPMNRYEVARQHSESREMRNAYAQIAHVFNELGTYIKFIAISLDMKADVAQDNGLTETQIKRLVYRYIGVEGGYLGDFSYRSHAEFYTQLDLDIDPYSYSGTTRERFIEIFKSHPPEIQARILQGILEKYPVNSRGSRTEELFREIQGWVRRLSGNSPIAQPVLKNTSAVVRRALADAEHLIAKSGSSSAVDRLHTALHGYQLELCRALNGVVIPDDPNLTQVFKLLRKHHPAFQVQSHRGHDIERILNSLTAILDALNPLRNRGSLSHPNEVLLEEAEARLFINTVRIIFQYSEEKIHPPLDKAAVGTTP